MSLSASQQRNAVSEGFALGMVVCGYDSIEFDKVAVDLSFEGAWRSWSHRHRFSQVSTDLRNGSDGCWVLSRVSVRSKTFAFYWGSDGRSLDVIARQHDWDVDNPDDVDFAVSVISGEVGLDGWVELARAFLDRLHS